MHYASIENVSKSYGVRTLFHDISFHIEQGDRIAFVAPNGSGKSTLLKIIAGIEPPEEGKVWVHKEVQVIMLQQEQTFQEHLTVWENMVSMDNPVIQLVKEYEELSTAPQKNEQWLNELIALLTEKNAWTLESEVKQILGKLSIHDPDARMQHLSGGQKKRVALAGVLLQAQLHAGNCLLILDEPTNHLDVNMIEWLERYLDTQKQTLILVTHDRYFLDAVCNEIIDLEDDQLKIYQGDYDYFLEQKAMQQEIRQSEWAKDKNTFRKELEWMRRQPQARTTKSKSRQDAFYELKNKMGGREEIQEVSLQMKMTRLGGKVLEMKKVYKSYGDKKILCGFDYTFKKGERIGIIGNNGTGKSTFLQIALGLMPPDSGKVNHGETVVFGHFSQQGLQYKEDKRAIEYVKEFAEYFPLADGSKISATQFMEKFGFSSQQQFTPLSKLSGGEKRRLQLLAILFRNPNFLVLDEPTNDLDLKTLRTLEEFLLDFPGCLLIVSHDRYFMDRLVDHLFVFEGGGNVMDFPGNYSQYRGSKKDDASQESKQPGESASEPMPKPKSQGKLSYNEQRELKALDKEIPRLEAQKKELEAQMSEGEMDFEDLAAAGNKMEEIINLLDEKELRWLELSEIQNPTDG